MTARTGCVFPDCTSTIYLRKMCSWHYRRVVRGELELPAVVSARPGSTSWQEHAACRGKNPELWFPVSERDDNPIVKRARSVCAGCSQIAPCLAWALENLPEGIAGGLTSIERRRIRQAAKAAALESVGAES